MSFLYVSRVSAYIGMSEWIIHGLLAYLIIVLCAILLKFRERISEERIAKKHVVNRDQWLVAYATRISLARSLSVQDILTKGYKSSLELAHEEFTERTRWYEAGILCSPLFDMTGESDDDMLPLSCEEMFRAKEKLSAPSARATMSAEE